jgi:hypothetical protein
MSKTLLSIVAATIMLGASDRASAPGRHEALLLGQEDWQAGRRSGRVLLRAQPREPAAPLNVRRAHPGSRPSAPI